ncbi:MAG: type IV secretory system conjugative DNA transfer family protein [Candidatus Pacearchaeota archaeon]
MQQSTAHEHITYIGYTNWRQHNIRFGIHAQDRWQHIYCLGKTGMGKSTLLASMALQDIEHGNGVAILDPHGDVALSLMELVPDHRKADVVYFNAGDIDSPPAYNPLARALHEQNHLLASEIVSIFKKNWLESWGVRLEYILRYCVLTLLEYPGTTLLDIQPLLLDKVFRNRILSKVSDKTIISFWLTEFATYTPSQRNEAISSILNKSGAFGANTVIKGIIGQRSGSIDISAIVDQGKILIVNLSKGQIGEQACALLGSMLTTSLQMAAMRQARLAAFDRKPFYVFLDEAHSFLTPSFAQMLAECRKYKLGLFLTHQYLDQLTEDTKQAVLGNVGTLIAFRLGTKDARVFKDEYYPVFDTEDFVNLPQFHIYIKLSINGSTSRAFSATINPP